MTPACPMLLAALVTLAASAARGATFAYTSEVALEGKGAIYALELPIEVLREVRRADLGDLRVVNGAGEFVPHALLRPAAAERKPRASVALPFFPLLGSPARAVEDMTLRVERSPDGTVKAVLATQQRGARERELVGYLLDASAQKEPLRELRLDWQAAGGGISLRARLEASDDLATWRTVAAGAPLVALTHGEAVLERRTIEFAPVRARYYRLSWGTQQPGLQLSGVSATVVDAVADAPRSWLRVQGAAAGKPGEYAFELPRSLPVDRLRFELPQQNTVASVALSVQDKPGAADRSLGRFVLYRLEHQGEALVNPDLSITPTREARWILRVDARGGGLGAGLPVMHAGWLPHRLVFVARGEPPFRLQFGDPEAKPAQLAVETLVPGYAPDKPLNALAARAGEIRANPMAPAATRLESLRQQVEQLDRKKAVLWGSLIGAVLLIVLMAAKLSKQLPRRGDEPAKKRPFDH